MAKKRINIKDVITQVFYQLPKQLFFNEAYRTGLSPNAKLLYAIIRDRFASSVSKTEAHDSSFVDHKGDIYCIVDNLEIEFTLNITDKTVTKLMKELTEAGLVETEYEAGKPKRLYLNVLESNPYDAAIFYGKKDFYKHSRMQKKKKLELKMTEEECIATRIGKMKGSIQKAEVQPQGDGNIPPLGEGEIPPLGTGNIPPLRGGDCPPPVEEYFRPNDTYSSNTLDNNTNIRDTNSNNSSSKDNSHINVCSDSENLEEDLLQSVITAKDNYAFLDYMLDNQMLFLLPKDRNVIKKILKESNIMSFSKDTLLYALRVHASNMIEMRLATGKGPKYEPAYFANNLVDRCYEAEGVTLAKEMREQVDKSMEPKTETPFEPIPFFNWLE